MKRAHSWIASVGFALAALAIAPTADAQCSGGSACPPCASCRVGAATGSNPSVTAMSALFDRVAEGPARYGSLGWNFGTRNTLGSGPGWCTGGTDATVPAHFPCLLLKAIYLTESSWRQFCASPGATVISFDCGYGIAQVTSGMRRGETSAFDPNRVASEPAYNVSVGAAILADKWRASPCVGNNDVDVVEDWYFAVWGYNGFVYRNNPNNPMFNASRVEFRTPGVASAQTRGNYPYQELVWGYAHYPLTAQHYTGVHLAYPRRSEICSSCGLPTADISEPTGSHRSMCSPAGTDAGTMDVVVPTDASRDVQSDIATDIAVAIDVGAQDTGSAVDSGNARDAISEREGSETHGGCGCRVAGHRSQRAAEIALLALATAAALARRRRR